MMPFVVTKDKTAAPKTRHLNLLRHPKPVLKLTSINVTIDRYNVNSLFIFLTKT